MSVNGVRWPRSKFNAIPVPGEGPAGGDLVGTFPNPTLAAVGTAGTYTKVTTDSKGRVTVGATAVQSDIPNLVTDLAAKLPLSGGTLTGKLTLGSSLNVPTGGAAGIAGNATLVAGTVTVSTTAVKTASIVLLTRKTSGGTIGTSITYTITDSTSFTITSDNILDTSIFSWMVVNGA